MAAYEIGNGIYQIATRNEVDAWGNATGRTLNDEQVASLGTKVVIHSALLAVGIKSAGALRTGGGTPCRGKANCFVAGTPVLVPMNRSLGIDRLRYLARRLERG